VRAVGAGKNRPCSCISCSPSAGGPVRRSRRTATPCAAPVQLRPRAAGGRREGRLRRGAASRRRGAGGHPAPEAARCLHCDCQRPVSCKLRQYAEIHGLGPQLRRSLPRRRWTRPARRAYPVRAGQMRPLRDLRGPHRVPAAAPHGLHRARPRLACRPDVGATLAEALGAEAEECGARAPRRAGLRERGDPAMRILSLVPERRHLLLPELPARPHHVRALAPPRPRRGHGPPLPAHVRRDTEVDTPPDLLRRIGAYLARSCPCCAMRRRADAPAGRPALLRWAAKQEGSTRAADLGAMTLSMLNASAAARRPRLTGSCAGSRSRSARGHPRVQRPAAGPRAPLGRRRRGHCVQPPG
jgi:hypothetical protein